MPKVKLKYKTEMDERLEILVGKTYSTLSDLILLFTVLAVTVGTKITTATR